MGESGPRPEDVENNKSRLADIFEREKFRFLRFVRRQVSEFSDMDAEDIVSDVTYNLLRRADVISEIENLTAYIYRSLTNRIADHQRGSIGTSISLDQHGGDDQDFPRSIDPKHGEPTPDQSYQQSELRVRLRQAIGLLPPKERAIWVATEIDGRRFRDLAEDWNEPIGTLLSRKSRATSRLRELLSEYVAPSRSNS